MKLTLKTTFYTFSATTSAVVFYGTTTTTP